MKWQVEHDKGYVCETTDCPNSADYRYGPKDNGRGWLCNHHYNDEHRQRIEGRESYYDEFGAFPEKVSS